MPHIIADIYFPTLNGTIIPSNKLSTILEHHFDTPIWQQGILATDSYADSAEKEYVSIADFRTVLPNLAKWDAHLYELLTENRPVRPYFDLEWDAEQLDEISVL